MCWVEHIRGVTDTCRPAGTGAVVDPVTAASPFWVAWEGQVLGAQAAVLLALQGLAEACT